MIGSHKMDSKFLTRLKLNGVFCLVVETGSMKQAALKLNISTAAVSQFISQLERELGITLLYRSTRKLSLSDTGEQYFRRINKAIELTKAAEEKVNEARHLLSGKFRIASPVGIAAGPIAEAFTELIETNPDLKLEIFAKDCDIDLVDERVDIEITLGDLKDSGLYLHHLGRGGRHIYASKQYVSKYGEPKSVEELINFSWLGMNSKGILNKISLVDNRGTVSQFSPDYRLMFNDLNVMIGHVRQGLGMAVLPSLEIREYLDSGEFVKILPQFSMSDFEINALTLSKNMPYRVKVALTILKQYFSCDN